jgi:myo-inositol-1(or 4)-monophosphatase
MDSGADPAMTRRQSLALGELVQQSRNIRATNSLVDFAMTIDGRLGACVNFNTKIWDIVAPRLILEEAGGCLTDLTGAALKFSLGSDACQRSYGVVGGNPHLHRRVVELLADAQAISNC